MTTTNNTTKPAIETHAALAVKTTKKEDRLNRRLIELYTKANWLGKRMIMVMGSAMTEGDEDLFDLDEYQGLTEALQYGEIDLPDYLKKTTHLWAIACDFKPRERYPYFAA